MIRIIYNNKLDLKVSRIQVQFILRLRNCVPTPLKLLNNNNKKDYHFSLIINLLIIYNSYNILKFN